MLPPLAHAPALGRCKYKVSQSRGLSQLQRPQAERLASCGISSQLRSTVQHTHMVRAPQAAANRWRADLRTRRKVRRGKVRRPRIVAAACTTGWRMGNDGAAAAEGVD